MTLKEKLEKKFIENRVVIGKVLGAVVFVGAAYGVYKLLERPVVPVVENTNIIEVAAVGADEMLQGVKSKLAELVMEWDLKPEHIEYLETIKELASEGIEIIELEQGMIELQQSVS